MESFGRLGVEGSNFIDQLTASVVGERDGRSMTRKGVVMERLLQVISLTTQVAISRRVAWFKLHLRDRQEKKEQGGGGFDPPLGHSVHKTTGDTWRAPARRLKHIWALLCRKQATKIIGPSTMAKNRPFFRFGRRA